MTLNQFTWPINPINVFMHSLSATLSSIIDKNNITVNQSVKIGIDAVLKSAIDGKPSADDMPCIRLFYDPYNIQIQNIQGVGLFQLVPIEIYCLFNVDFPDPLFAENRDSYIWNLLNYLKYDVFQDHIGMKQKSWWKFQTDQFNIQHNVNQQDHLLFQLNLLIYHYYKKQNAKK